LEEKNKIPRNMACLVYRASICEEWFESSGALGTCVCGTRPYFPVLLYSKNVLFLKNENCVEILSLS